MKSTKQLLKERKLREEKIQRLCFEEARKEPFWKTREERDKELDKIKWDEAVKGVSQWG